MPTYLALLRGINISGQKKIKMAELRHELGALRFEQVRTYIQSGNIAFEAEAQPKKRLGKAIAGQIFAAFGHKVPVLILEREELQEAARCNPFLAEAEEAPAKVLLTFLSEPPAQECVAALREKNTGSERFEISGTTIYLYCPDGYGRARLNNNFLERQLKVSATTRNWKTVRKLLEL